MTAADNAADPSTGGAPGTGWEAEGQRLSAKFDGLSSVCIVADDADAAALVALGIARAQAIQRRVAIADLVGETPVLQSLVADQDAHGISDSFLFGVSLNRIARPVGTEGNLFVMPSGSEPVQQQQIYESDRWRRLSNGFREAGALLLLVAPADAAALDNVVAATDGVVLVGIGGYRLATGTRVLAMVNAARTSAPRPEPITQVRSRRSLVPGAAPWLVPALAGVTILLAAGGWLARQRRADELPLTRQSARAPVRPVRAAADSIAVSAGAPAEWLPGAAPESLVVLNPQDSAQAAIWGVQIVSTSTGGGALARIAEHRAVLPAATVSPVVLPRDSILWFRVISGAFTDRADAYTLLADLRRRRVVAEGFVVRTPYALRLLEGVAPDSVRAALQAARAQGLNAYALRQRDGSAHLYSGAFERPEDGVLLADSLRRAGSAPALVYRMGRSP